MKHYSKFINQKKDLQVMKETCKQYIEWSTSEFESDMWDAVESKINNLIKYYEKDK
tara:strand:+ start:604 stop:771 length:168 start_codon:yes stop_codon:yes gene_type:complete